MSFKSFSNQLTIRILFIIGNITLATSSFFVFYKWPLSLALFIILFIQALELHYFVNSTNRKLTMFLNSVKYSDFVTTFTVDNKLGNTFRTLNKSFNQVLDAFRNARIEKEEHLQYLHMIVEHVDTGLLSFEADGKVDVINGIGANLLGVRRIKHLEEIKNTNQSLYNTLMNLPVGERALFYLNEKVHLSIRATQFTRRGKFIKLLALQNIQQELSNKELESWQNLLKVLRHEIMNSMTPISSLTATMQSILAEDLVRKNNHYELSEDVLEDINDSLSTIEGRSKGLITFLNGYRDYTSLPTPKMDLTSIEQLFESIKQLMGVEIANRKISFTLDCEPKNLDLIVDKQQMEQVLINLVKNAMEAFDNQANPYIIVRAYKEYQFLIIEVEDNGIGIIPEALERIFIPFYTTKKEGSGIGLSLSKQIVQMNNGTLSVFSEPNKSTVFKLVF